MRHVAEDKKTNAGHASQSTSLSRFIREQVTPIARAFAEGPLMVLRVKTGGGRITLVKSHAKASAEAPRRREGPEDQTHHGHPAQAPIFNGEVGRSYTTVNAEVVGIFRDLPDPPAVNDKLSTGQVLGHIEALRLRNPVRCPIDGSLVAQVAADGQPVDFGETLFVVDSGLAAVQAEQIAQIEAQPAAEIADLTEPPRM